MHGFLYCLDHLGQYVPIVQDFWTIVDVKSSDNYRSNAKLGVPTLRIWGRGMGEQAGGLGEQLVT
jgi:hypothetical protein